MITISFTNRYAYRQFLKSCTGHSVENIFMRRQDFFTHAHVILFDFFFVNCVLSCPIVLILPKHKGFCLTIEKFVANLQLTWRDCPRLPADQTSCRNLGDKHQDNHEEARLSFSH